MGLANLVAILKQVQDPANDYRDIPVPEWGGDVRLRRLDADDWLHFVDRMSEYDVDEDGNFKLKSDMLAFGQDLLCRSIVDEAGELAMDSDGGRKMLKQHPFILMRLMREAMELSGLAGDVEESIEGAKKNSAIADSASSASTSPSG
jgi:hypothetical protein